MDIARLSSATSQSQLMTNVGVAVLSKQLDTLKESGANMIKMMEQSVNPNVGQNIDITL